MLTFATLAACAGSHHETAPHWSYQGNTGPAHWAELDPSFSACEGTAQTPIDFPSGVTPGLVPGLRFTYRPSALTILNNGHTVQANYDQGSKLELDGVSYELAQLHFHAHSEHTVANQSYPLEMHLVHKSAEGKLAVLAVFIQPGVENAALAGLFSHMPKTEHEAAPVAGVSIDASKLLPSHLWAFRYRGSLTTPPCTEGVEWTVFSEAITASSAQIQAYTSIYPDDYRPTQPQHERAIAGAHFSYEGEQGPAHWGDEAPGWGLCSTGKQQSPIDIPLNAKAVVPADVQIHYVPAPLSIVNNGHTVEVEYPSGSEIDLAGTKYALVQFHFHARSEHAIGGKTYPLELHLVHKSADGALAVVGVLIEEGAANATLEPVFNSMPASAGPEQHVAGATIDAAKLLPPTLSMYRYEGSLTTPPCSEHVKWHVLATPIQASAAQIAHFTHIYQTDARPTQPLGERAVQ
ncbi:MAG TPA: carbonic anhydrase family protein [Polyangiales bacterium]|nr:carbonic anhydrase family protein [Polyangiales bacterium]